MQIKVFKVWKYVAAIFIISLNLLFANSVYSFIGSQEYYKIVENNFIKESANRKKALEYIKELKQVTDLKELFYKAQSNNEIKKVNINGKNVEILKPGYENLLDILLKFEKNLYADYIGTDLILRIYGLNNEEVKRKYLMPFVKNLYKHKYCTGYLIYGDILYKNKQFPKAKKVWSEGKHNCKVPYLRTFIIGRLLKYF